MDFFSERFVVDGVFWIFYCCDDVEIEVVIGDCLEVEWVGGELKVVIVCVFECFVFGVVVSVVWVVVYVEDVGVEG